MCNGKVIVGCDWSSELWVDEICIVGRRWFVIGNKEKVFLI